MVTQALVWSVAVPGFIATVALAIALRIWSGADNLRAPWGAALAIVAAYVVGSWGQTGGLSSSDDLHHRLIYIALGAGVLGAVDAIWTSRPKILRWVVAVLASLGMAWVMVAPLVQPQGWSVSQVIIRLAALGGASLLVWVVLDNLAASEQGASLPMSLLILGAGGSAVIVLSGSAGTGQLSGAIVAGVGGLMLVSWRYPAPARIRSAVPAIALLLVAHWSIGLLYSEMPEPGFALLALAPLSLLVTKVPRIKRASKIVALVLRMVAMGLPVGGAVGVAAAAYFDDGSSSGATTTKKAKSSTGKSGAAKGDKSTDKNDDDDDYGYD